MKNKMFGACMGLLGVAIVALYWSQPSPAQTGRGSATERATLKVDAGSLWTPIDFHDGCDSTMHLSHGLTLTGVDGCSFCVQEGVLDASECTVTLTANRPLGSVKLYLLDGAIVWPFGVTIDGNFGPFSCEGQQLSGDCWLGMTTLPYFRIDGVVIGNGFVTGLEVVRR